MTLNELLDKVREEMGQNALPGDLANRLTSEALARPDARELLVQAVFPWVHAIERARVREAEKEVFSGPVTARNPYSSRPPNRENPAEEAVRALLAETCEVPGHGRVPWGKMTAEYHKLRIGFLAELRAAYVTGISATIARHQLAAGLLDESGCENLEEYAEEYGELPLALTER